METAKTYNREYMGEVRHEILWMSDINYSYMSSDQTCLLSSHHIDVIINCIGCMGGARKNFFSYRVYPAALALMSGFLGH